MQKNDNALVVLGGDPAKDTLVSRKRIGATTYLVSVRFSGKATETLEDKVIRLINREVSRSA